MKRSFSKKNIILNLLVYGLLHFLIDGICVIVILNILWNYDIETERIINYAILYNALAFGLQAIVGLVSDYLRTPRIIALLGCILVAVSLLIFNYFPILTVILAGIGNALFHVGGGSISLNLTPKRTIAPGIFVAPGAVGIFLGILIARSGEIPISEMMILLVGFCLLIFVIKKPEINYNKDEIKATKFKSFELPILLIFSSIAIRSLIGFLIVFPWKTDINLLILLTLAILLGKGIGGIIADRFGWIRTVTFTLILSIPLLIFGLSNPILGIIGIFLFNITMPVTLVALSNILPGRPGFSFGLTCLALIIGAMPSFIGIKSIVNSEIIIFSVISISCIALFYGLRGIQFKGKSETEEK